MNLDKLWHRPSKDEIRREIDRELTETDEQSPTNENEIEPRLEPQFSLEGIENLTQKVPGKELYGWYSEAMARRNREPLSEERFLAHFFDNQNSDELAAFGEPSKGYLLGFNKYGVFIPSHFAPKTLRGGYELVKALGESEDVPAVLAITEDLGDTLDKMPAWNRLDIGQNIISRFRDELVKKAIYYNSHPDVKDLMMGLMMEYINETHSIQEDEEPGEENEEWPSVS